MNEYRVSGTLVERQATRFTPAGIPVCEAKLAYQGSVTEAGSERDLGFELPVIGLGDSAKWLEAPQLGTQVSLEGFMAPKSRNSKQLVLHLIRIEYL